MESGGAPGSGAGSEAGTLRRTVLLRGECALRRAESRGAHYRTDFPAKDNANFRAHSVVRKGHPPQYRP